MFGQNGSITGRQAQWEKQPEEELSQEQKTGEEQARELVVAREALAIVGWIETGPARRNVQHVASRLARKAMP
jgi:hypothetical protein